MYGRHEVEQETKAEQVEQLDYGAAGSAAGTIGRYIANGGCGGEVGRSVYALIDVAEKSGSRLMPPGLSR